MDKTFYLWDLADTLFPERWNAKKSGVSSFDAYVESLGYDLKTVSPHDYEWAYEKPYREGLFDVTIADGFREVLSWAKYNGVFTTGNREQIDWRAEQLQRKYDFDIRDYIGEIHSTFDYGNTNVKTAEMLMDILRKKFAHGFGTIVYIDDKEQNCRFFLEAVKRLQKEGVPFRALACRIKPERSGIHVRDESYTEVGTLFDLQKR